MAVIATAIRDRAADDARAFDVAQPFRHVVIDGFLVPELCDALLADFPGFDARHALNEMGEVGGKAVRMDVRDLSDAYRALDDALQTPAFLAYVSELTGIPDLLYDPDYVGGGTHENRQGQGLDPHVDFNFHPRTRWHRRLNLIVYLNPEWDPAWGGNLELHSDPWDPATNTTVAIAPLFNRAVVFETTETSWHGFSRIQLPPDREHVSRKSFAIYLYTVGRPERDTAAPHATVYVPDALPADWSAGRVLSVDDLREAGDRFARLRGQLHFLYEREKHFGAQIAALEHALGESRQGQRLELQGYATQPVGVQGVWPDRWAGASVAATLVPSRPATRLLLELWAPPQLGGEQRLTIRLDGSEQVAILATGEPTTIAIALDAPAGQPLQLRIEAARSWVPSAHGDSRDERALAYRFLSVVLKHGHGPEDTPAQG